MMAMLPVQEIYRRRDELARLPYDGRFERRARLRRLTWLAAVAAAGALMVQLVL